MAAAQNMAMTTTQKIIAIAVTIIIISTVAIPVIDDILDDTEVTVHQNAAMRYQLDTRITADTAISYSGGVCTIGSTVIDFNPYPGSYPLIITDTFVVTLWDADVLGIISDGRIDNVTTATLSASAISFVDSLSNPVSISYSAIDCIASNSGIYGAFPYSYQFYFNKDANLISTTTQLNGVSVFKGTYNDMDIAFNLPFSGTVTDISMNINVVDSGKGYYSPAEYTYSATINDVPTTVFGNVNSVIIAPIDYTVDPNIDIDGVGNLIAVIPILLILVPLMMAVRMIALKRN